VSRLPILLIVTLTAAPVSPAAAADPGWWHSDNWVDYGLLVLGAGAYLGMSSFPPREEALVGPAFDPDDPAAVLDPALSDRIGRRHLDEGEGETVPEEVFYVAIPALLVGLGVEDALVRRNDDGLDLHGLHDTLVGFSQAVLLTLGATETLKVSVGRLRPDFQDRYRRHACSGDSVPDGVTCPDGIQPLESDRAESADRLDDGRKSFPSGHSSISFALATYGSLVIGGHFVWGDGATRGSRTLGIAAQTALMGAAAFTTASRVDDGRHHLGDVMTGAALGFGLAQLAYWRHFGLDGRPLAHDGGASVRLGAGPGDAGLALVVRH